MCVHIYIEFVYVYKQYTQYIYIFYVDIYALYVYMIVYIIANIHI